MEEKKFYLKDALSKTEIKRFTEDVENLNFAVQENYPLEDIRYWLDSVCRSIERKKIEQVV